MVREEQQTWERLHDPPPLARGCGWQALPGGTCPCLGSSCVPCPLPTTDLRGDHDAPDLHQHAGGEAGDGPEPGAMVAVLPAPGSCRHPHPAPRGAPPAHHLCCATGCRCARQVCRTSWPCAATRPRGRRSSSRWAGQVGGMGPAAAHHGGQRPVGGPGLPACAACLTPVVTWPASSQAWLMTWMSGGRTAFTHRPALVPPPCRWRAALPAPWTWSSTSGARWAAPHPPAPARQPRGGVREQREAGAVQQGWGGC